MIKFPDFYTQTLYDYFRKHDDEMILYRDIIYQYNFSYPTIRKRVKWLQDNGYIKKIGRRVQVVPQF